MNKQIKELVQKAEALTEQEWHRLAQSTDGMPAYKDLFNQMFAELIVQECVENLTEVWYEQGLDIRGAELDKFLKRFQEHLGVEQ